MYKFLPIRQLIASTTALSLALSTVAPAALAQDAKPAPAVSATAEADAGDASAETTDAEAPAEETAPAEPTEEEKAEASAAYDAGIKSFDEGDFLGAAESFKTANAAVPSAHAEYWIARSVDLADAEQKTPTATVQAYDVFLGNPGAAEVDGGKARAEAEARASELRANLPAELTVVTTPEGATVTIDGEAQEGVTPLTIERPAGTHTVEATLEGHDPLTVELELKGGEAVEQTLTLTATPAEPASEPPPAEEEEQKEPSKVPAYVTLGIAGAGLITGTVFGILALDSKSKYDANPSEELAVETERNALIADMSFGIMISLGVTGVVLLTSKSAGTTAAKRRHQRRLAAHPPKHPAKGKVVVAPYGGPTGGGGVARLTF